MAFGVLSSAYDTAITTTNGTNPVTLLDQVTVSAPGGNVQFLGYAEGAYSDSGTMLQVLVDDVVVCSQNAFCPLSSIVSISAGDHTIDFRAISNSFDVTLTSRGLTVLSLA